MTKVALLSAAAVAAVLSGPAPVAAKQLAHKPAFSVLWNQNSNFGSGINSQDYESGMSSYNDAAADDFVIPAGQTWRIAEVDVTGSYANGSGPASSEVVAFYRGKHGKPCCGARGPYTVNCTDNGGSFQCVLPARRNGMPKVKLKAGTYWVSVVAKCDSQTCGEWNWTTNTIVQGNEATWANWGGGWGTRCGGAFQPIDYCFGGSPTDLAFTLIGTP